MYGEYNTTATWATLQTADQEKQQKKELAADPLPASARFLLSPAPPDLDSNPDIASIRQVMHLCHPLATLVRLGKSGSSGSLKKGETWKARSRENCGPDLSELQYAKHKQSAELQLPKRRSTQRFGQLE